MILADTSIWADYIGRGDPVMAAQLDDDRIIMHPYVIGEIALGNLRHRARTMADLHELDQLAVAEPEQVLALIDRHALHGTGIGYVDAHLLASTLLAPGTRLWTRDKRLRAVAERLEIAAKPVN